jgi:hypothetical protein
MTSYQYSKTVNVDRLTLEINTSTIITALESISALGTEITINFKADLSTADKATLDTIVANHVPNPLPSAPEIQVDDQNAQLVRLKFATVGWTYLERCFNLQTSNLLWSNFNPAGQDMNDLVIKLFDSTGALLNVYSSGVPVPNDPSYANTVVTQLDFEPNYDYELIGGYFIQDQTPTSDVFIHLVAVPDIPSTYGGTKIMLQNFNLKYFSQLSKITADGRTSKRLTYSSTYHTNKLRLTIRHAAGLQHNLLIGVQYFKA